jgi:hypothetical protein
VVGKHEPGSKGSFYLSLTTAALRAGLVIAAVVLGVFVLSRAFVGGEPQQEGVPGPVASPTASPEEEPPPEEETPEAPPEEARQEGVVLEVRNGTNEAGLAQDTADELTDLGYEIVLVGNAARNYDQTTLFFQRGARPEAAHLADLRFEGAVLERMADDTVSDAEIIVVLGLDFVNG